MNQKRRAAVLSVPLPDDPTSSGLSESCQPLSGVFHALMIDSQSRGKNPLSADRSFRLFIHYQHIGMLLIILYYIVDIPLYV